MYISLAISPFYDIFTMLLTEANPISTGGKRCQITLKRAAMSARSLLLKICANLIEFLFDKALLSMGGNIGGLFLLVKAYFDRHILHLFCIKKQGLAMRLGKKDGPILPAGVFPVRHCCNTRNNAPSARPGSGMCEHIAASHSRAGKFLVVALSLDV